MTRRFGTVAKWLSNSQHVDGPSVDHAPRTSLYPRGPIAAALPTVHRTESSEPLMFSPTALPEAKWLSSDGRTNAKPGPGPHIDTTRTGIVLHGPAKLINLPKTTDRPSVPAPSTTQGNQAHVAFNHRDQPLRPPPDFPPIPGQTAQPVATTPADQPDERPPSTEPDLNMKPTIPRNVLDQ